MPTVGEQIVAYARAQIGDPYVWGATGPNGFDCSGLVYAAYKAAGYDMGRTRAVNLGKMGAPVTMAQAVPGDVVYFDWAGTDTDHVGIYIGNGQMIDAPTQGKPVGVRPVTGATSFRRFAGVGGPAGSASGDGQMDKYIDNRSPWEEGVDALGDAVNPFDGWQSDGLALLLKVAGAGAAIALVVIGAKETMKGNS